MAFMKCADGVGNFSFNGMEYKAENGIIEIPDGAAVLEASHHGYVVVTNTSEFPTAEITPFKISEMSRSALLSYCEDNNIEVPKGSKVSDLRALVQTFADGQSSE